MIETEARLRCVRHDLMPEFVGQEATVTTVGPRFFIAECDDTEFTFSHASAPPSGYRQDLRLYGDRYIADWEAA